MQSEFFGWLINKTYKLNILNFCTEKPDTDKKGIGTNPEPTYTKGTKGKYI